MAANGLRRNVAKSMHIKSKVILLAGNLGS
jgi:hypothetical protein